ncbi:glucose-6-phosphate isomerase [Candidatus Pelagibacter sp.]|nr:glucose-6-phosphate isomerase [Candidatus Pelagibacter sp.]
MLSKNIRFKNFTKKKFNKNLKVLFKKLTNKSSFNDNVVKSFSKSYSYSFTKKQLKKFKKFNFFQIYGMGGSSLGIQAIYDFMKPKIKKKFYFFDNLDSKNRIIKTKSKSLNLIISKSGNTLETIVNENIFSGGNKLYITENNNNYLRNTALRLKKEIIEHKNFIGGRYSVLSEVGMLPAELMGLNSNKFKRFDKLVSNRDFINSLLTNVNMLYRFVKMGKTNSIILNYDESSYNLFRWYQQLVAESLGKNSKGVLPIISEMPKDNHSLMQLYLDGNKNSFFTFFDVKNYDSPKIKKKKIFSNYNYLKKHDLFSIKSAQKKATINVFKAKGIPFRTFEVLKKNEETLGELFTFFMLETILLGKMLKINPYDQPAVELIKKETKKILI